MALSEHSDVDLGALGRGRVELLIGEGGEGYVYAVRRQSDGLRLALKWYKPTSASEARRRDIQALVESGPPHTRFLWPLSLASVDGEPEFGYVMRLREDRFLQLSALLVDKHPETHEPLNVSFASTITMCRQLGFSFLRLHAQGRCYRDISFGNVFFDPSNGDVLICDNDNVGYDDGTGRILGTPYFMAPEIVADTEYRTVPSTDTDRHSLAVLLFYILFVGHPLEGARTDADLRDERWLVRHFGSDPLFCMHPDNAENRPSSIVRKYWEIYPQFLRSLFVQAFGEGLTHPTRRVTEGQWIKAMDRLRDSMIQCDTCGATGFWDWDDPGRACHNCGTPAHLDFVLEVGKRSIVVSRFATIRTDHTSTGVDDTMPLAKVRIHPQDAKRWGLANVSEDGWTAVHEADGPLDVPPGETVDLAQCLSVRMPDAVVTVRPA